MPRSIRFLASCLASIATLGFAYSGELDSSQFHAGASWVYRHTSQLAVTGQVESAYDGVQIWKIDSLEKGRMNVSWVDSGRSSRYGDTADLAVTHHYAIYDYGPGSDFYFISGDSLAPEKPLFAQGNALDERATWAVIGADTVRVQTATTSPCIPSRVRYVEKWGLTENTRSVHCGITSNDESYRLLVSEGRPYKEADLRFLPATEDFAPDRLNMSWKYRTLSVSEWTGVFGSNEVSTTRDTLDWSMQIIEAKPSGFDSVLVLRVDVTDHPDGVRPKRDTSYQESVRIVDGEFFLERQLISGSQDDLILNRAFPRLNPFYHSHGAILGHVSPGKSVRDSLVQGSVRKVFGDSALGRTKVPLDYNGKSPLIQTLYAQGLGMIQQWYSMPQSGVQPHNGYGRQTMDTRLVLAEVSGIHRPEQSANRTGRTIHGLQGIDGGLLWLDGSGFGPDGKLRYRAR